MGTSPLNFIKLDSQDFLAVCPADCDAKRLICHLQHIVQRSTVVADEAADVLMGNFKSLLLSVIDLHTGKPMVECVCVCVEGGVRACVCALP